MNSALKTAVNKVLYVIVKQEEVKVLRNVGYVLVAVANLGSMA